VVMTSCTPSGMILYGSIMLQSGQYQYAVHGLVEEKTHAAALFTKMSSLFSLFKNSSAATLASVGAPRSSSKSSIWPFPGERPAALIRSMASKPFCRFLAVR